jgi:hypothetical protein
MSGGRQTHTDNTTEQDLLDATAPNDGSCNLAWLRMIPIDLHYL